MLKIQTTVLMSLFMFGSLLVMPTAVKAQAIDADKLEAAKKAAYEKYLPEELRGDVDNNNVESINVDNATVGHAAYIYGNTGPRPTSTITGPVWNHRRSNYYPYGNYNYNITAGYPIYTGLNYHFGHRNPFNRSGRFVMGDNYTLPSVFQDNYDSRYRRSQPKLFKVRTYVPQHYTYQNGRYHFVRGHSKVEVVPLVTRFIRTRYNHGHHSIQIDYSN